jgi:cytochrome c(L)
MQFRSMLFAGLFVVAAGLALPSGAAAQSKSAAKPAAEAAAAEKNPYTGDAAAIADGKKLWMKWGCYGCHGTQGGGGMGPSLIDESWLYGGTDAEVFESIHDGRPKGMPAWDDKLSKDEIQKVMAYLRSSYKGDESGIVW